MTPEAKARTEIDTPLAQAGWLVQGMKQLNFGAAPGVAVREYPTDSGPADYVLFVNRDAVDVIEAKHILFLADTRNLGKKAHQEFMAYTPSSGARKLTELHNVQSLVSPTIDPHAQVRIRTIQRMHSILSREPIDESAFVLLERIEAKRAAQSFDKKTHSRRRSFPTG